MAVVLDAAEGVAYPQRMRTPTVVLGMVLALAPAARAAGAAEPVDATIAEAAPAAAARDRVLAFTAVPDAARRLGETRLVVRAGTVVVQTLLSTKLLARVLAEIRGKEEKNWPDRVPGADGRRAYLDALASARAVLDRRSPGPAWTDRRQRLLIEFAADDRSATVVVGTFETMPSPGEPGPAAREILASAAVPRSYVLRNQRLILADSFHLDEKDVDRLGPLGPAAAVKAAPR